MGEVYVARDDRLEREVAVKVLSSTTHSDDVSRKRFRKEALTLSRLNHPNIATILDYDTQEEIDFLVMEYIVGSVLGDRLESGPLPEKAMVPLAIQIALALEEAHSRGVVHRDLKPNNIIVTPKDQIKVLDFGLAKLVRQPSHDTITQSAANEANLVIGTLAYMSPEQLRSEPVDVRSDVYSLGVVLYEMSTGKRPHTQTQPISLADAVLHKAPPPPGELRAGLSPLLQQIILKCLEKDPANRYQSVKELLVDLRRLETPSMSLSALLTQARPHPLRKEIGTRAVAAGAGVLLIAAALVGILVNRAHRNAGASVNTPISQIESLVAVPSKVYGTNENLFLGDAIPNALSAYLSRIEGIETRVPPTAAEMDRMQGDLSKLGSVYEVSALVSSSVTVDADRLLLNVQLIDAGTRRLLWSENYDGRRENYLALVRNAADGLHAALRPKQSVPAPASTASRSTDAEFAFQRGLYYQRAYSNRKTPDDFNSALADLKHALELDPTNARASASLAFLYGARIEAGAPLAEVLPEIDRWAYQALQLDYRCGEAWQVLSMAEEFRPNGDKQKRLEYALRAATYSGQSGYSHHVLATALSRSSFDLSLTAALEGVRREPLHLKGLLFSAGILARQGQAVEGLKLIDRALSIEPNMPVAILMKDWLLLRNHQYGEAQKYAGELDKMVAERRMHPGLVTFAREWLDFEKSVGSGNKAEVASTLQRLVSEARGQAPPWMRWEVVTGNVLGIQAQFDTVDATIETLMIRRDKKILEPYDWLLLSPELKKIRNDPRFEDLLPASRAEFRAMLSVLEDAHKRNELPSYLEKPLAQARSLP